MANQNANDNDTNVINADNNSSNANSNRNDDIIGGKHSYITIVRYYICKII